MGPLRHTLRRAVQVLLCASAIAGGAAISYLTGDVGTDRADASLGQFPLPMPSPLDRPTPTAVARPLDPAMEMLRERPVEPRMPVAPFADPLSDGLVITGATPHRLVLFTFDDGPDPRNTPRLLDILDDYGVRAVFFLTASRIGDGGPWQRRNSIIARDIVRRGHVVANHTVDHAQLPLLDDAGVLEQVLGAEVIFEQTFGERTWLVRPPGGGRSARVDRLLTAHGYTQVLWNLGTGDFQVRAPEEVFRIWLRVLERRERENGDRGGIVLLHDTHEWSVDAVPMMLSWIREQNCELLEAGEELYDVVDDPALFFTARADADPSQAAPPAEPDADVLVVRQARLRDAASQRCARVAAR